MTIWKTSLLDPPWEERGSGKIKRGADRWYPLLKTKDMPGVILGSGLWTPDENAHVYMFVTNTFLPDGLWLLKELGARYITNLAWTKKRPGIGRYFRGKHELLLFATIGRGWAVRTAPNNIESTLDTAEEDGEDYFFDGDSVEAEHEMENGKRKHSAKPRIFYDLIESRSQGPYAEFFARSLRPGWQTFGNDVALTAPSSVVVATQAALARQREEAGLPPEPPPKKTRAKKADVMPIAEMDGVDIMLNASREPVEATCPQCLARVLCVERETSCTCGNKLTLMPPTSGEPPRYRAYAFANGKVQGEVPKGPEIAMMGTVPVDIALAALGGDPAAMAQAKTFMRPVGKPAVPLCRHGDPRSECILCRARR